MPDPSTSEQLKGLYLSAADLRSLTDWPEALIEDYLNLLENIVLLGEEIDTNTDGSQLIYSLFANINKLKGTIGQTYAYVKNVEQSTVSNSKLMSVINDIAKKLSNIEQLSTVVKKKTKFFCRITHYCRRHYKPAW